MKAILKKVYSVVPFKQQIFSVIRRVAHVPNSISKHLYFNGVVSFKVGNRQVKMHQKGYDVENTLFWRGTKGCWEKVSVTLWIELCKSANVIFDIGANTGAYGLIAKAANPQARVFAIEPMQMIFERLQKNVELNKMDITCFPVAVSDFDGMAKVFAESDEHVYSITVNKNLSAPDKKVREVEITARKLSTIIEENSINKIDLIKLDVETHEAEALKGMGEYLAKWKPTLLIEILNDEVGKNVQSLVAGCNYLFFNIDEEGGIRKVDEVLKSDYYNYLFCSREKAVELKLIKTDLNLSLKQ
jgi:FkbM family methyltransferase